MIKSRRWRWWWDRAHADEEAEAQRVEETKEAIGQAKELEAQDARMRDRLQANGSVFPGDG